MTTLIIDGMEIRVKPGATIMEAARQLGVTIPHFCYHPKLSVAGNCRMCLVEVEKMPRPVISCSMPVSDGMVVKTNSEMVVAARKGVMEFLLINHPLDCPVCDQGGECDLQDLAMKYGPDRSRFQDRKQQSPNYDLGPLIETEMNRCIHCTRCIRFSTEVAGVEEMGAVYRGDHMRVGPFVEKLTLSSELIGNIAEACPVGALNLKPFHFQARGWELQSSPGVCNHCSVGCQTRNDHLDGTIKRVQSRESDAINLSWLCDKGRFSCDGLTANRLKRPTLAGGNKTDWPTALDRVAELLKGVKPEEVAGLADGSRGAEELFAFQDFLRRCIGTPHMDHRLRDQDFRGDQVALTRADLLMNTPLTALPEADAILLIGSDSRYEVPLLNLRLRQASLKGTPLFSLHVRTLNSNLEGLRQSVVPPGHEVPFLQDVLHQFDAPDPHRETGAIALALREAKRPVVLLGDWANHHPEAESLRRLAVAITQKAGGLTENWHGFNRVDSLANSAAAQDLGVVPHRGPGYAPLTARGRNSLEILQAAARGEIKVLFLLGVDPSLASPDGHLVKTAMNRVQTIYLGSHWTPAAEGAAVVLASLAQGEKESTHTNSEGRVQRARKAVNGPMESKEDWRILRALSDRFDQPLPYDTLEALRAAMAEADPHYRVTAPLGAAGGHGPVTTGLAIEDREGKDQPAEGMVLVIEPTFYRDDPVSRNSHTLSLLQEKECIRLNPNDAAAHKIADGQSVILARKGQAVTLTARLDGAIPAGVVLGRLGNQDARIETLYEGSSAFPRITITKR